MGVTYKELVEDTRPIKNLKKNFTMGGELIREEENQEKWFQFFMTFTQRKSHKLNDVYRQKNNEKENSGDFLFIDKLR